MLEEHLEYRRNLRVYTPDQVRGETWIWGIGPDYSSRPYRGPVPYKMDEWIDTVWAYPDGRIYIYWGSCDVSDTVSETHPRFYGRIVKGDDIEANLETWRKIIEELQHRENWKKYERRIPKVLRGFRKYERLAVEVSKKHDAQVKFWINSRRWAIRAILNTGGMDEDEKLRAINKAATALKDFNDRLYSET